MIVEVSCIPLEELLPSVSAGGTGLLVARAWIMMRVRKPRKGGT